MQIYSREEVLRHNKIGDCWIIINNDVYDVSEFIKRHPGGSEIIESRAGEDATSYFIAKHRNNKRVLGMLSKLKIGEVTESERITANDFSEDFLTELIDRCYQEKLYSTPPWHRNIYFFARLFNIIAFFGCSVVALYAPVHWSVAILLVMIQAIIGTSLFGLIAHEAIHRNFPRNRFLKKLTTLAWPIFWPFIIKKPFQFEHNSHHIKIGDPEFDYEVNGFAFFIRYSGKVKHTFFHNYQHLLAIILYPFYANILTIAGGFFSGFWDRHNQSVDLREKLSMAVTFLYFIGVPALISSSLLWYVLLYFVYQCTLFNGIYIGAAINHFVPSVLEKIPDTHKNKFGYYVCHHTSNFCTSSPFWIWYTGGFNIQIEHHLVPFIPVENLTKMVSVVKELCRKYGYPYREYSTIAELWADHYAYLRVMSQDSYSESIITEIMNKKLYQAR